MTYAYLLPKEVLEQIGRYVSKYIQPKNIWKVTPAAKGWHNLFPMFPKDDWLFWQAYGLCGTYGVKQHYGVRYMSVEEKANKFTTDVYIEGMGYGGVKATINMNATEKRVSVTPIKEAYQIFARLLQLDGDLYIELLGSLTNKEIETKCKKIETIEEGGRVKTEYIVPFNILTPLPKTNMK